MLVKDLTERLQQWYKPDDHLAVHIWEIDDVTGTAKEMGAELSADDANEILDIIDSHIDCEYGITWETIKTSIQNYLGEKVNG